MLSNTFKLIFLSLLAVCIFTSGYLIGEKTSKPSSVTLLGEPVVMRTKGGLLEVSKVVSTEQINQSFPGLFSNNIVTITVPATYRYHVELAPEWKFIHRDNTFIVISPPIKSAPPVAIDTSQMTVTTNSPLPMILSHNDIMQAQQQITPILNTKFNIYKQRQREDARKTISEFIKKWVLSQDC